MSDPLPPTDAPPIFPAQMPDDADQYPVNPMVQNAIHSLFTLPQRAIENSQNSLDTGNYDPGPTLEAATLPMGTGAIAGVPVRAGEAVLGAGPIRAYHGSPHDFDAFSMDKIGTGEGAQAYGHGLYFAENEGVARSYRDTLGGDTLITPKGTVFDPMTLEHMNVRSRAHSNGSNLDATIDTAQKIAESDSPVADMAKRDLDKLLALKAEGGVTRNKGSMYEVNINADPEHFLDWDKPLSEQHPVVQDALKETVQREAYNRALAATNKPRADQLWAMVKDPMKAPASFAQELLQKPEIAQKLREEAAIPGIKYLDQGSRGAGEGSRNYVVFNDKLVDILKKYGIAGLAPGLGAPIFAKQDK